ncbi:CAF1-domain-containing protein [Hypoxylon sp. FL0890]|nr:CAF1-domain-containing protein [Hypoxylon sp. FL0890]
MPLRYDEHNLSRSMEVNRSNFFLMLPSILYEAQKARFVAIDIEMSGISYDNGRVHPDISVQDSYTKIKEAAELFQVLQIGFTFIVYDEKRSEYTTRTFNCPVSPLFPKGPFPDRLARHLDRNFLVSAKSYNFLRQHNFDLHHALDNGIYYLSRREQKLSEQFCLSSDDKQDHIDPLILDEESQHFYKHARGQIARFVASPSEMGMKTFIKNPYGDKLNSLQVRLVHQLIREEYPNCTAKRVQVGTMAGCVSVATVNRTAEVEIESRRRLNMDETKKLSGGSFAARINQKWVYHSNRARVGADSLNKINDTFDFQHCEASLKKSRPIIVGHNLFRDLAFIYNTFFEPLPPQLDDFLTRINTLFPRIVDTKYMHTRGGNMMEPDRTLQELHDNYTKFEFPIVRNAPKFGNTTAGPHDAGFDSCMTAVLFLKQAHSLFTMKKHLNTVSEECHVPTRQNYQNENGSAPSGSSSVAPRSELNTMSLLDEEEAETSGALQNWDILVADESASRHVTLPPRDANGPSPKQEKQKESVQKDRKVILSETYSAKELHIIPLWADDFWKTYGNKSSIGGARYVSFA